jgi:hypothetical protein
MILMHYDASTAPLPEAWLGLDELERVAAVRKYHKRSHAKLPNAQGHAIVHTIVENQLAEGHAGVVRALDRLVHTGLDRHEAVHAIGATVTKHMSQAMQGEHSFSHEAYEAELEQLTAKGWVSGAT